MTGSENGGPGRVLRRFVEHGTQVAAVERAGCAEYFLTLLPGPDTGFDAVCRELSGVARGLGAVPVSMEVFGVAAAASEGLNGIFGGVPLPVTWVEEGCCCPVPRCGVQVWAVAGASVEPVVLDGRIAGTVFDADGIRYCRLGGLVPGDLGRSRAEQTREIFDLMERALDAAGMNFSHTVRTWFYNRSMLEWYDEFNAVRTAFFRERGVFDGLVPASTGIGGRNSAGAALTAGLLAVKGGAETVRPFAVASPLQCPAPAYGSSFSRAAEFSAGGVRRLYISGTASIEPGGKSVHINDLDGQIDLTMDVVGAILESRRMDWRDVSRAVAYFKCGTRRGAFHRCLAERGIPEFPTLLTNTDICRDDLLFELELDAVAGGE